MVSKNDLSRKDEGERSTPGWGRMRMCAQKVTGVGA